MPGRAPAPVPTRGPRRGRGLARVICVRVVRLVGLLFGVSLLAFTLVYHSPVDPIAAYIGAEASPTDEQLAQLREYWGLDRSFAEQYLAWLGAVLGGDLGVSKLYQAPVLDVIADRFMMSLALMGVAWLVSGVLGYALGVIAAMNRHRLLDRLICWYSYTLASTPTFWLAILLLTLFAVVLGWFPVGLAGPVGVPGSEVTMAERFHHFVLPAATLSALGVATIAMHTRERMLDVLDSDYVAFARARGEHGWRLFRNHGLRNSIVPALALQFAYFSELFGGSILAEQVFSYPGLGSTLVAAGLGGDVPMLLGIVLLSSAFVFVGNLIADILTVLIDPRTRNSL
ncbi:ABC transporter permease [Streptomyces sp. ST2-7A]|uniref:ABC transporter permease n=1 Tax=Streptomyces sp. ST2-7A TaxID=2907214 RepID=UPI001F1AA20E|nr:ABC transporter permease [Streptomyces sp. ST2-7A]MCE7079608.1 ABC transporter permease [Streptomyces sp. ST2-7A]